jgi:glycosyltransferase involved in cell wall biosynthesis
MHHGTDEPPAFGLVSLHRSELSFTCIALEAGQSVTAEHLAGIDIVLGSADSGNQLYLSRLCHENNVICVYIIENIPEGRYKMNALSTHNPILKLRRDFYIWNEERRRISAFNLCHGLQSNGTPAYNHYSFISNNLLYFDTRVHASQIVTDDVLQKRLQYLSDNQPLRLAFSGRLISIKGADHLVRLAHKLKQAGTPFQLTIYGSGELEQQMRDYIAINQLQNEVYMPGTLNFYEELLPELKENVDVFVCLHRQGDPSCTYLETLSCGIPIVGYDNEAFTGLMALADIGWLVKMDDLDGIAETISFLHEHRAMLFEKSENSLDFARQHDFDSTFQRRINHLLATVDARDC